MLNAPMGENSEKEKKQNQKKKAKKKESRTKNKKAKLARKAPYLVSSASTRSTDVLPILTRCSAPPPEAPARHARRVAVKDARPDIFTECV
jgi:hypothetical protein